MTEVGNPTLLYQWTIQLLDMVTGGNKLVQKIVFVMMALGMAGLLNLLVNVYKLNKESQLLTGLTYLLLLGLFNEGAIFSPAFFASIFVSLSFFRLFQSYGNTAFVPLFDAAFLSGIAFLYYPPVFLVFIALFIGLFISRLFNWREWMVVFFACLLPYYLLWVGCFLGECEGFLLAEFKPFPFSFQDLNGLENIILLVVWIILGIIGILFMQMRLLKIPLKKRKLLVMVSWYLVGLTLVIVFGRNSAGFLPALIPMSILFAYFFYNHPNKWLADGVHLVLVALLVLVQYFL